MSIDVNPEEDFHVVVNGNVLALSLDALSAAYEEDVIGDASLIWQQGLGEWMRLDVVLSELEKQNPVAPVPPPSDDMYFVLVAPGDVKQMSLDLLADAYRLDVIDDATLIWQPGYTEWIPLLALLGESEPENHYSIAPSLPPSAPSQLETVPYSAIPSTPSNINGWSTAASAPPLALSVIPPVQKASPWFSRVLIGVAALGTLWIGHRQGVSYEAAMAFGQQPEATLHSLGHPSTQTPYGLDLWLHELEQRYALDQLSETTPIKPTLNIVAKTEKGQTENVEKGEAPPIAEQKAQSAAPEKPENATATAFGAQLANKPAPPKVAAPKKAAPLRSKSQSSSGELPKTSDHYDPMNGNL